MFKLEKEPLRARVEAEHYAMELAYNRWYLNKHGVSCMDGKPNGRTTPWFDSGYWMRMEQWLRDNNPGFTEARGIYYFFEQEKHATMFRVKWS